MRYYSVAPAEAKRIALVIVGLFVGVLGTLIGVVTAGNSYCRQHTACEGSRRAIFRFGCECIEREPVRDGLYYRR